MVRRGGTLLVLGLDLAFTLFKYELKLFIISIFLSNKDYEYI